MEDRSYLFHFLGLRIDGHAQLEIRTYANAIGGLIAPIVPLCWEAFRDYRLRSLTLSGREVDAMQAMAGGEFLEAVMAVAKSLTIWSLMPVGGIINLKH